MLYTEHVRAKELGTLNRKSLSMVALLLLVMLVGSIEFDKSEGQESRGNHNCFLSYLRHWRYILDT